MPHQRDTIVSKRFREIVLATYPDLAERPDDPVRSRRRRWFAFLDLLCFSTFLDTSLERAVISRPEVLEAIGLPPTTPSKTFNVRTFLDEIRDDRILGAFRYLDHMPKTPRTTGRARVAVPRFSKEFRAALDQEIADFRTVADTEKVHLVTGERWTPTTAGEIRSDDLAEAQATPSSTPEAQRIIDYLNGLPSNVFAMKVNANIDAALLVAKALPDPDQRRDQLTKLHRIVTQPQPLYGPSKKQRTVRVFARNVAIQNLKNVVKYALIDGWVTFDLRSSQLAIVAKDWGLDGLRVWLSDPANSIWKRLTALFPDIAESTSKPALKTALYSVCYGAGRKRIRTGLAEELGIHQDAVDPFFTDELIATVLRQRLLMRKAIIEARDILDCFGRTITCTGTSDIRSVMAQLSQAQEMQLLLPAIDLAEKRKGEFRIVFWEHDGFSVHFTRKDRIESESQRIITAVSDECSRLGYPTRLERKDPSPLTRPTD